MQREWADPQRVAEYLSREIPHRDIAESMLIEALPKQVGRFLDLGTGAGRLVALIRSHHPDSVGIGIDVSEPMLARAEERFQDDRAVTLVHADLDNPIAAVGPFDAVVSGLAIHHLSDARKRALFAEIHALLAPDGVFINIDLVSSSTHRQHERFRRAIGREQDDPTDQLAELCDQLRWLGEAGFHGVDCDFKWLELALIVARKRA